MTKGDRSRHSALLQACKFSRLRHSRLRQGRLLQSLLLSILLGQLPLLQAANAQSSNAPPSHGEHHAGQYSAVAKYFPGGQTYSITDAANRLAASSRALTACRDANVSAAGYCDLTKLGTQSLRTTAALKSTIPNSRYPLYLWRFSKADSVVYLAGSIHLLKPGFYPLPPQYEQAFELAGKLVLEVDTAKLNPAEVQQKTLSFGSLPPAKKLNDVLPASTYDQLAQALLQYGAPITHFQRFKPNLVIQQLALFALLSVGYNLEAGLEHHFRSRAATKTVLELESFDFQLDLLLNVPMQTQVEMTQSMLDQLPGFEPVTADLVSAWLRGDDETLGAVSAAQIGDTPRLIAFNQALIEKRNHSMKEAIVGYLHADGSYFVLVGAAHLIDKEGIPALLTEAGYLGTRVFSDQNLTVP